jgi:acyl dehydratase
VSGTLERLESMVGERVRTVEGFVVEAGKVEEFARALGDGDPVYRDPDVAAARGFDAVPAPLTFVRTSVFPRYRTGETVDLGFRHEHTLHGQQAFEYDRPLLVGDTLTGDTGVVDAYEREGSRGGTMTFAVLETSYHDADGERVLVSRSTAIETDGTVDAGSESEGPTSTDDGDRGADPGRSATDRATATASAPTPVEAGEIAVGDRAPAVELGPLARRDVVRYAGASGDLNPIHFDEPYARAAGNPAVFGQGMFTAGVAAHAVAGWLGLGAIGSFDVRFRSRVWPGDTLSTTVEATAVESVDGGERVSVDLRVERDGDEASGASRTSSDIESDGGDPLVTGSAEAVL